MPTATIDDLRASGVFSYEHGLTITTVPTTTMPYRLAASDALRISQGANWDFPVVWYHEEGTPRDLSGTAFTATFTARATPSGAALIGLTQSSGITLGSVEPNIVLSMTAAATTALSFTRTWCQLDVTETGVRTWRLFEGFCDLVG